MQEEKQEHTWCAHTATHLDLGGSTRPDSVVPLYRGYCVVCEDDIVAFEV